MHQFLILFFIFSSLLSAKETLPYLTSESDALVLFEGIVNTHNGQLVLMDQDISIEGPSPLQMTRYYDSGHHFDSGFGYGIGGPYATLLHLCCAVNGFDREDSNYVELEQRMGSSLLFRLVEEKREGEKCMVGHVPKRFYKKNYTNCCEALLRGEPSIYAMEVVFDASGVWVDLGNGTKRYYRTYRKFKMGETYYLLDYELFGNGNKRYYEYHNFSDFFRLKRIYTTNSDESLTLNWLNFSYKAPSVFVRGSNGESAEYVQAVEKGKAQIGSGFKFSKVILKKASVNGGAFTEYEPTKSSSSVMSVFSTERVKKANGHVLYVDYDKYNLVRTLFSSEVERPVYTFDYYPKGTVVRNVLGGERTYFFYSNSRRLKKINEGKYSQEFSWDDRGQLLEHTLYEQEKLFKKHVYSYDTKGNIIQASLEGAITDKEASDFYTTRYSYSDCNEVLTKRINKNVCIQYSYERHLLASQLTYVDGALKEREFYAYDKNGILIEKIIDDGGGSAKEDLEGASYRLITVIEPQLNPDLEGFTLPHWIKEYTQDPQTGSVQLLRKVQKLYTQGSLLAEERTYDCEENYCYSRLFEYNAQRQLVRKVNPLGIESLYAYDSSNNRIYKQKGDKKIFYTYDLCNNLIEERLEGEGTALITKHLYDGMGNRIQTIDPCNQSTYFSYDTLCREIKRTDALGYSEYKAYNAQNLVTVAKNKEGHLTKTSYNLFEDPLEISHPDGTQQSYRYNLEGDLVWEQSRDGSSIAYKVDYKGRALQESHYSKEGELLKTLYFVYKGPHLISKTDALGNVTEYVYDCAGRKVEEREAEKTTYYRYDSLGRLYKTICGNSVRSTEYDFLDRPVQERIEDLEGIVYKKTEYAYDSAGNRTLVREYDSYDSFSESLTAYNVQNLPILERDALGYETHISYTYTDHLEKENIENNGRRTIEVFDPREQLKKKQLFSAEGQLLAETFFDYDRNGKPILQKETQLLNGIPIGSYSIQTLYNSMGERICQIEQDDKITQWEYSEGRLSKLTLPNGVRIHYQYDPLGRLIEQYATDSTLHQKFSYDLNDNLLIAEDLFHQNRVERRYDAFNRLNYEKQANGAACFFSYDLQNRLIGMRFGENCFQYIYNPISLVCATWFKQEQPCFHYTQECNYLNKPLRAHFADTEVNYTYDALKRCKEISTATYRQNLNYNSMGYLVQNGIQDALGCYSAFYSYDELGQLIQESSPFENLYTYDSLNNRQSKNEVEYTLDAFNQLVEEESRYTYDPNGRRLSKDENSYTYDALGRLLSFNDVHYAYDALGRRTATHTSASTTTYLYQLEHEIASYTDQTLTSLRFLYQHVPLAFELEGTLYTPIRNHRGDICQLVNNGQVLSNIRYDAFGLSSIQGIASPYLFCGQRYDHHSNLYHFPQREYDPCIGRWLTPDPLGFADGPNLYAYVRNNPLIYIDPQGLFWEEAKDFFSGSCRGAVDDASWGTSEYVLGTYEPPSTVAQIGYYSGVAASLVAGLAYGSTEAKIASFAFRCISKLPSLLKTTKTLYTAGKVTNMARRTSSAAKVDRLFAQTLKTNVVKEEVLCLDRLSKAGQAIDRKGLTRAGRALDKHASESRPNTPFPKPKGNEAARNEQGQFHLDDILTHPQQTIINKENGNIEFYVPDGRGACFKEDGFFRGFIQKDY